MAGVGRRRVEEAGDQRAVVEAGAADDDGTRPRAAMSAIAARASAAQRAAWNGSSGWTTSSRWCGTRARSAAVGLAVPMSMPR